MKIELSENNIQEFVNKEWIGKFGFLKEDVNFWHRFSDSNAKYHHLLAYISSHFENATIFDIGTCHGHSAVTLSVRDNNTVYTYDNTDQYIYREVVSMFPNINSFIVPSNDTLGLENILTNQDCVDVLLKSELLFFDVDPHSGVHETEMFDFLVKNDWKGLSIWDDTSALLRFWFSDMVENIKNNHPNLRVYDLTKYSWSNGTSAICFGNQEFNEELLV